MFLGNRPNDQLPSIDDVKGAARGLAIIWEQYRQVIVILRRFRVQFKHAANYNNNNVHFTSYSLMNYLYRINLNVLLREGKIIVTLDNDSIVESLPSSVKLDGK